jgi:hypothetical protein
MYKNIIPHLVSFDTKMKRIRGLFICRDINFFGKTEIKNRFHYKIYLTEKIKIPQRYDFRSEYFIKKDGKWFYERKIWFLSFKFMYDPQNKIFYLNKLYSLLPCRIGGVFMIGEHISHLISLDLFLHGFTIFRGCAFQKNNRVSCIVAPGFNGKTTFLKKALDDNGKYVAEDLLILDNEKDKIFPTCPFLKNYFLQDRKILLKKEIAQKIIEIPLPINKLYLVQNLLGEKYKPKDKRIIDFILLDSMFFLSNNFIKSIVFEEALGDEILKKIIALENDNKFEYEFIPIKNFKFLIN